MATVKHVQIHLTEPSRGNAARALYPIPALRASYPHESVEDFAEVAREHALRYADECQAQRDFTGPHFHGVDSVACSEGTVDVHVSKTCMYMYPLNTVARVKVYTEEAPDVPKPTTPPPLPPEFAAFDDDIPF